MISNRPIWSHILTSMIAFTLYVAMLNITRSKHAGLRGLLVKAIEYLKNSLESKINAPVQNDLSIADTLKNLGDAYFGLTYKKKSLYHYESALQIYYKILPKNHSFIEKLKNKIRIASFLLDIRKELDNFQSNL